MVSYYRSGSEFGVNSFTVGNQTAPALAGFSDGGFVVAWGSSDQGQDGHQSAIKAQLFDSDGNKSGVEFRVNSAASGYQFTASVAALSNDNFLVTWVTNISADGSDGVKAQLFSRSGAPIGDEFFVKAASPLTHATPKVVALADGGFVVTWDDSAARDVKARIYDAAGDPVGVEFTINSKSDYSQEYGDLTALADGGFVATWRTTDSTADGSEQAVKAQVFDGAGNRVGTEFLVNTQASGWQYSPTVTGLAGGGFVVAWQTLDTVQDGSNSAVKAQLFTASGAKVGGEFLVNTQSYESQSRPVATALPDGGFMIAWDTFDAAQDGSSMAVKAQVFSESGAKVGGEFLVNSLAGGAQWLQEITTLADGRVVIAWAGASGDGDGNAVRAQIYNPNTAPRFDGGTSLALSIDEGDSAVGTMVATDSDGPNAVSYSITGGPDAEAFAIDSVTGELSFVLTPDHEAPADAWGSNFYTVTVSASDGELSSWQSVQILVGNVNEGLAISSNGGGASASVAVAENGAAVATVSAVDADGTSPTYAIVGGADAASFTIDAATGELVFGAAPDFEAAGDADGDNVYEVVVAASDGAFADEQALAVTVTNVREGNVITGTSGKDTIAATTTAPGQPYATAFEDTISGLGAADALYGGGGNDIIKGGAGNDNIVGGAGADQLTGGTGADRFVLKAKSESCGGSMDVIADFSRAQGDRIGVSAIDANSQMRGDQKFAFIGTADFSGAAGQLRFEHVDGSTFVTGDINGDRVADFQIQLQGLVTLAASDFIL